MISFRSQSLSDRPAMDAQRFREVMGRPAIVREFFLPVEQAWWDGGRYTLGRWLAQTPRPHVTGVRLQEPRAADAGVLPERDTQGDLGALVRSVAELRKTPELAGVVLSEETLVGTQSGTIPGKRVVFGLSCPADGRFKGESAAAKECERVLRRAARRAGYIVEHPRAPFDGSRGFAGLLDWAGAVRLRQKKLNRRLLVLLLLPLLLLSLIWLVSQFSLPSLLGLPTDTAKALDDAKELAKIMNELDPASTPPPSGRGGPPIARPPGTPGPGVGTGLPRPPPRTIGGAPAGSGKALPAGSGKSPTAPPPSPSPLDGIGNPPSSAPSAGFLAGGMEKVGIVLAAIGGAITVLGTLWLMAAAWEFGLGWVLAVVLIPGAAFVFALRHWSASWKPVLVSTLGGFLLIGGLYLWLAYGVLPKLGI